MTFRERSHALITLRAVALIGFAAYTLAGSVHGDDKGAAEQRAVAARAAEARKIQASIPTAQQQSRRDIASILKQLREGPERVDQAQSAAEALAIQERNRYRRPYFRSGEERRSARGVLDTSLAIVYDQRKIWRPKTVEIDGGGRPVVVNVNGDTLDLTEEGVIDARLRSYEGRPVGPTLRVKPGEILG